MLRTFLRSKIHRATVTEADLNYTGSITIDPELMKAAAIMPFEKVDIYDITNGNRLSTYAIAGQPGGGEICINGAAARLVDPGDRVIICCYGQFQDQELPGHRVHLIHVDERNRIREMETTDLTGEPVVSA